MVAYIFLHFLNYLVGVLVIDFGRKKKITLLKIIVLMQTSINSIILPFE